MLFLSRYLPLFQLLEWSSSRLGHSGTERSIEADLASLSTSWFSTALHPIAIGSARNDDEAGHFIPLLKPFFPLSAFFYL